MYQTILREICQKYDVCKDIEEQVYYELNQIHPCVKLLKDRYKEYEIEKNKYESIYNKMLLHYPVNHHYCCSVYGTYHYNLQKNYKLIKRFSPNYDIMHCVSTFNEREKEILGIFAYLRKYYSNLKYEQKRHDELVLLKEIRKVFGKKLLEDDFKYSRNAKKMIKSTREAIEELGFNPEGFFNSEQSSRNGSQ